MKASTILNPLLTDVTPGMHQKRRKCLQVMVNSLMSGASLTVTSLGRNIQSQTTEKHQIKRSTRLCSNTHLYAESITIYSAVISKLVTVQTRPVILVDWSDLDPRKQHFLLRAAIAVDGRSLTLLEKVYPLSKKEKPAVHKQFMKQLKSLLPEACRPIIVTDAGFRGPWFKLITSLGWDFVGRVRNRTFCRQKGDDDWYAIKALYVTATSTPKSLGTYQLCRSNPVTCQLHLVKENPKGRKALIATSKRARKSKNSRQYAMREKEPWLLATSLTGDSTRLAKKVVKIYQSRMQIEESFRDLKTGLNMNNGDTRKLERLAVLLLIAMLAQFILYLLGLAVKLMNKHRQYQANSLKKESVLSYQFIGLRAFKDRRLSLKSADWTAAYLMIQQLIWKASLV